MSKRNKSTLGRGLDSLLGGAVDLGGYTHEPAGSSSIALVDLSLLDPNPDQPRQEFDSERLTELAESIRHLGIVQPLTVQMQANGRYLIISGERRYRAARMAELKQLPVYIRQAAPEEVLEMALVENIQREDLNAIEVALAYQQLSDSLGLTHEALAERVGKKRATISNYLRLLKLPAEIQMGISQRLLDMAHARALLQVEDTERQLELYHMTINERLSVREVEELARAIKEGSAEHQEELPQPTTKPSKRDTQSESFRSLERHLGKVFDSRVSLRCSSKGKGSINIPFKDSEDLERIIVLLERILQ